MPFSSWRDSQHEFSSNIDPRHSEWKKNVSPSRVPSPQSTDQNIRRLLLFDFRTCPVPSYGHWLFSVMPICARPFRVIPICVMPFRVMPICVMPFRVMPFRWRYAFLRYAYLHALCLLALCLFPLCLFALCLFALSLFALCLLPLSMPFCILTSCMIPETGFCPSASVWCIPDLKHGIGLLLFCLGLMHACTIWIIWYLFLVIEFCHRYTSIFCSHMKTLWVSLRNSRLQEIRLIHSSH